ncbi:hypothetical protein WJX72_007329 [[Myrmecia] bisecta]|uniref:Uncharacterized protein n=1 Tax=[Myrmecia] bisecta TaxID=41462 RepID=A0AAW1QG32_9CHLO
MGDDDVTPYGLANPRLAEETMCRGENGVQWHVCPSCKSERHRKEAVEDLIRNQVARGPLHQQQAAKYRKEHPRATDEMVIRHLLKTKVTASMPGSPKWWAGKLADLKAITATKGMPTMFWTVTADEHSNLRFEEMPAFEDFIDRFDAGLEC